METNVQISFEGQVAIVTGAGGGLGRAHALELGRRGAQVVVNDFRPDGDLSAARAVAEEITSAGGEAIACLANVADMEAVEAMVADVLAKWGRIDVLINNAGILRDKSFAKMEMSDWRAVIDVHLNGAANCTRAVWPVMKEQNYGRILMTTSSSGIYGNFGQANYGAAKMGLIGLMNTLCIEGAKNDIRINCLSPTAATAMTEGILPDEMMQKLEPDAVTPAAVFLVSRDAPNRQVVLGGAGQYAVMDIRESANGTLSAAHRSAERFADLFAELCEMRGAVSLSSGTEHVEKILG